MIFIFFLAIIIAIGNSLPVNENADDQNVDYHIHSDVTIDNYDLTLTLDENWTKTEDFSGKVLITLILNSDHKNLELHSKELTIKADAIKLKQTDLLVDVEVNFEINETTDILTITENTNQNIAAGAYTLEISFNGKLNKNMNGFYISSYYSDDDKNTPQYLATTQFESTFARRAFPCFDEPEFKSQFFVTIECPNEYNAISNSPVNVSKSLNGNLKSTKFLPTPTMSTYLLAFIISHEEDFKCQTSVDQFFTACSRTSVNNLLDLAQATAPKVLEKMKVHTNFDYTTPNIQHLQQVAIPDFAAGAMENWELITYRESVLLWNEEDYSLSTKQKVITVIAHELAHQWFGNVVTLKWWSDTFLNEGFATLFEYQVAHEIDPSMELDEQFVIKEVQSALAADSDINSKPLHFDVDSQNQISARFDKISYSKGGSILRMVQSFVDEFDNGLQSYISNHHYGNTEPQQLWESFLFTSLPNIKLEDVINNWINKAGYPLISVKSDKDQVIITQEQFVNSQGDNTKWYVPITYKTSQDTSDNKIEWLKPDDESIIITLNKDINWVIVNDKATGYYRVNYDEALWNQLFAVLNNPTTTSKIDEINKAQIVDDLINFASFGKKQYKDVLKFLEFLKIQDSYYPWYSAINGFNNILKRIDSENVVNDLKLYILDLMTELKKTNPSDFSIVPETHIKVLKKELTLKTICNFDDEDCVNAAINEFNKFKNNPSLKKKVNPNYRSVVYCTALRKSDNVTLDSTILWSLYDTVSSAEQNVILISLGCLSDQDTLTKYLKESIQKDGKVRKQDVTTIFASAVQSRGGVIAVLNFINTSLGDILSNQDESTLISIIALVTDRITNQDQLNILQAVSNLENLPNIVKNAVDDSILTVQVNLKKTEALESEFKQYFNSSANQHLIHFNTFISTIIVLIYSFI